MFRYCEKTLWPVTYANPAKAKKQNAQSPMASPSMPSVRLTALLAPVMTSITRTT